MTDDKDRDKGVEPGGMKDTLQDEFDEAAGEKKKKDDKESEASKSGDKNPGGLKDRVKDEFDKATGKGDKEKDRKDDS